MLCLHALYKAGHINLDIYFSLKWIALDRFTVYFWTGYVADFFFEPLMLKSLFPGPLFENHLSIKSSSNWWITFELKTQLNWIENWLIFCLLVHL